MAQVEPMDIDAIESDFDNKENAFQFNNVLSRTPCTEKGYEELDVSELNMKLRYSVTPVSSPMSKSLTGPCLDNRSCNSEDYLNNTIGGENGNLTYSLNSTLTKSDGLTKTKALPLQTLSVDPFVDSNRNSSVKLLLDQTDNNVTISVNNVNDHDENLSLPSPCSSTSETPEATTPTKEIPKPEGSPIMRGLKSVLSMFRPSQSPVLPTDDKPTKQDTLSPVMNKSETTTVPASTPVADHKQKDATSKRSSPLKESLVFNDDLERELLWKDESTIIFKDERIPVHKLLFQNPTTGVSVVPKSTTVEDMDISCDESIIVEKVPVHIEPADQYVKNEHALTGESDNEFLDCETTFSKNDSCVTDNNNLDMFDAAQKIGNTTNNLLNSSEISKEIIVQNKTNVNNTICDTPVNTTICTDVATMFSADVSPNSNITNIIEATINLLASESIDYRKITNDHNVDLHNGSKDKILNLENQNITMAIDKQGMKDSDVINPIEGQPSGHADCLKGEKIMESRQKVCCDIDKPIVVGRYEMYTHQEISSEASQTIEISKSNVDIVTDSVDCNNRSMNIVSGDIIGHEPSIDKPNINNESACLQNLDLKLNADILPTNEDMELAQNNDNITNNPDNSINVEVLDHGINEHISILKDIGKPISSKNCNSFIDNLNDCENNFNDKKIIDSMPVTESTKGEENITINTFMLPEVSDSINPRTSPTVQFEASNDNDNMPVTQSTEGEILAMNSITLLQANDSINPIISPTELQFEASNVNDNDLKSMLNSTHESNNNTNEHIWNTKEEPFITQKNTEKDLELEIVRSNTNIMCTNNLVVNNDIETFKPPSEIPLPDDDNIEQHELESNGKCKKDFNTKESFEISKLGSNMNIENEFVIDNTNYNQSSITLTNITINNESSVLNPIIENPVKTDNFTTSDKVTNIIKTSNTHKQGTNNEILDVVNENLTQIKKNIEENNTLHKELLDKEISVPESNFTEVDVVSSKMSINDNIVKEILIDTFSTNPEQILIAPETDEVITEKYCDVSSLGKAGHIIQDEIGADKQSELICKKRIDEIDEEIITSANNSPYVSVTDLDKFAETRPNDTIEDSGIPVAINTTIPSSPPASPKIVSKGYNFNFDEIEDPFATKTKIRISPTHDIPNQSLTITKETKTMQEVPKKVNRRKAYPDRKKSIQKKNMNSTFSENSTECTSEKLNSAVITPISNVNENILECQLSATNIECKKYLEVDDITSNEKQVSSCVSKEEVLPSDVEIKNKEQTLVISTEKSTSSSEQYFSLGTSSGESCSVMNRSKNVFNLPEIDDANFATKSKMRSSPTPIEKPRNSSEIFNDDSKMPYIVQQSNSNNTMSKETEITFEKKIDNDSSTKCLSNNTYDMDSTDQEIATEDEDTVEGPFIEMDDLNDTQKIGGDIESDMMNFDEIPQQERDENLENGELFIDADAFEFLLNQNKSTTVSDSGKESLFLKFDPLFAKRVSSDGILAALSKVQNRQSTPKKLTILKKQDSIPVEEFEAGPSNIGNLEGCNEDLSSTVTKPMMVVNPAVSQKKPATPKINRRSLTFTSPAMAVIDRLLSLSGNSSHLEHNTSISQTGREYSETTLAITQLRELLAEKEINVHTLRTESKELKDRLAALEFQVKGLENESAERLSKINQLNDRLLEKTKINKSMAVVVEEYERTIASLIAETEQDKKHNAEERIKLIKERDEQTAHLTSMEVSFSDLQSKYEKSKQIILSCKANEDTFKKSIHEFQDNFSKMQNNYELLKQHATSKLNHANQELEKINRAHEAEALKLKAMIRRKELHITSLEETLAQKTKANEELTALCDELINKVG